MQGDREAPTPGLHLAGLRVTVMGLGLHGGGRAVAQYLHRRGAIVTVTDLRTEQDLRPQLEQLPGEIRLVLGTHREEDFRSADLVVKNPAVPRTAPLLRQAPAVTTDIALFLADWSARLGSNRGPLVAVTGTKGKSSTAGACAAILGSDRPGTRLGGNIAVSPLLFLDELRAGDPVVLELSSFQLGDLRYCRERNGRDGRDPQDSCLVPVVAPQVAIITSIFPDHQDYYHSMDAYVADKEELVLHLPPRSLCILGTAAPWTQRFAATVESRSDRDAITLRRFDSRGPEGGGTSDGNGDRDGNLLPPTLSVAGDHMRTNVAMAAVAAHHLGMTPGGIRDAAGRYSGIPHRQEHLGTRGDIRIINDTAATIPEAAEAATRAYPGPVVLIAGGSDKGLDLSPLVRACRTVTHDGGAIILLAGTGTDRLIPLLRAERIPRLAGADSMTDAFDASLRVARAQVSAHGTSTILLSPGCASFGMFRNEFDRGDQFRLQARRFLDGGADSGARPD